MRTEVKTLSMPCPVYSNDNAMENCINSYGDSTIHNIVAIAKPNDEYTRWQIITEHYKYGFTVRYFESKTKPSKEAIDKWIKKRNAQSS